ncbi:MAG: hypothetical protein RML72_00960 [Bacteroidia bacterium]|nr:hypothetical protein [Bacteroidia bacterium]MDW8157435.1 hypothetical protein [Bacteroidia bacterium]
MKWVIGLWTEKLILLTIVCIATQSNKQGGNKMALLWESNDPKEKFVLWVY